MSTTPTLRDAAQALSKLRARYEGHTGHKHPGNDQWRLAFVEAYRNLDAALAARAAGYSEEWCRAAAEAEEAGNACWDAGAALTQGAGAVEPVATVEALQARIAKLEAELDDMEAERDEALRGPWPEWAEQMKKTIRKYSGYDGFDDASEGIDLAAELDELMEHAVEPSAQQLQQAVARATEEAAKRTLDHISKVIWVERDRYVTLLGKCIAQGDKKRADTYEQIARALDELHEGIQP